MKQKTMCSYQKYLRFFFQAVTKCNGKPEKKTKKKETVNPTSEFKLAQTVTIPDGDRGTSSGGNATDKSLRAESTKQKATGDIETSSFRMNTLGIQRGKQRPVEQESVGRHSFYSGRCVQFMGHREESCD